MVGKTNKCQKCSLGSWWTLDFLIFSLPVYSVPYRSVSQIWACIWITWRTMLKHRILGCIPRGSNSVGLGKGPIICISNDSQVMLMLWVQKPHFENHYLGVLPVTLKPILPSTPIFTTLYWLLVVSQIKLKPNKVSFLLMSKLPLSGYLILQYSSITHHYRTCPNTFLPSYFCYAIPVHLESPFSLSSYFSHSGLSTNAPSTMEYLLFSFTQATNHVTLHWTLSTFYFSYVNFCFLCFLWFLLEYVSKLFY